MQSDHQLLVYCEVAPVRRKYKEDYFGEISRTPAILDLVSHEALKAVPGGSSEYPVDQRSLVEFEADYELRATLRADTWYSLPVKRLGLKFKEHDLRDPNTPALFRGVLTASKVIRASEFKVAPHFYAPGQRLKQTDYKGDKILELGQGLHLTVVDCGQGNWNEITGAGGRLIYDMGASLHWSRSQIRSLVASRKLASTLDARSALHVVISHWDVDHYHALLEATPDELACIDIVVGPDLVPNTATVRRTLALLAQCGVECRLLKPSRPPAGSGRKVVLQILETQGPLTIFRATRGSNRNLAGIVVTVQGPQRMAVLTGDHHHDRVLDAIRICFGSVEDTVYVVPHHGGRAGRMVTRDWQRVVSSLEGVVSYGEGNSYGHPFASVIRSVDRVSGYRTTRTARSGDVPRVL